MECHKKLVSWESLVNHFKFIHKLPLLRCLELDCSFRATGKSELDSHIITNHNKLKHKCMECDRKLANWRSLVRHFKIIHKLPLLRCLECSFRATGKSELESHMIANHKEKDFRCMECDRKFAVRTSLYRHVRSVHFNLPTPPKKTKKQAKAD